MRRWRPIGVVGDDAVRSNPMPRTSRGRIAVRVVSILSSGRRVGSRIVRIIVGVITRVVRISVGIIRIVGISVSQIPIRPAPIPT